MALSLSSQARAFSLEAQPARLLQRIYATERATWLGVFVITVSIFALTAHWWTGQNPDGIAAAWPAWQLVHHGTFDLASVHGLPTNPWFFDVGDRVVSNRMPGVILVAVPANLLLVWTRLGPEQIGALTAAVISAAAVANVATLLRRVVEPSLAVAAAGVLAFGTAMWTVAGAELWTHGPDAFWLSLGLLMMSRQRYLCAGLALAPAVLTRPHLAVTIAVLGLWETCQRRTLRPCLALGVPAALAVAGLVAWNQWTFRASTLDAGYGYAVDNATRAPGAGAANFATNVAGSLVSGWCGLLLFTPVAMVLICALPHGWRPAPSWARAALVGGLAYQCVQFRINSFTGGGAFYGNRLVIELLVLATPVAALGYAHWSANSRRRILLTTALAALSVAIHGTGALLADYWVGGQFSDWTTWYPEMVVRAAGWSGFVIAGCAVLGVLLSVLAKFQGPRPTRRRAAAGQTVG